MKHKEVVLGVCLMAGVAGAGGAKQLYDGHGPDVVVSDSFFSPEIGSIKLVGVCDPFRATFPCWDVQGKLDRALSEQVKSEFKPPRADGQQAVSFSMHFRRKNRIAIFESPDLGIQQRPAVTSTSFYSETQSYLQPVQGTYYMGKGPARSYLGLDTSRSQKVMSIFGKVNSPALAPVDLSIQPGTNATTHGQTISVVSIGKRIEPNPMMNYGGNNRTWPITIKLAGDSAKSNLMVFLQALDKDGKIIDRWDANGKPTPPPKPMRKRNSRGAEAGGIFNGLQGGYSGPRMAFMNSAATMVDPATGCRTWYSVVNPAFIDKLRLSFSKNTVIQFKDIALDPKP